MSTNQSFTTMATQKKRKRLVIRDGRLKKVSSDTGKVAVVRIPVRRENLSSQTFWGIPYRDGTGAFHICPKPLVDTKAHT
jgi:hypothetical protein